MKLHWIALFLLIALGSLATQFMSPTALAAAPTPPNIATPLGKPVDLQVLAQPLGNTPIFKISGTLISITEDWLVIQEGSYEHWIATDKVITMRVSR